MMPAIRWGRRLPSTWPKGPSHCTTCSGVPYASPSEGGTPPLALYHTFPYLSGTNLGPQLAFAVSHVLDKFNSAMLLKLLPQ